MGRVRNGLAREYAKYTNRLILLYQLVFCLPSGIGLSVWSGSFVPNSTNITWETKADYTPELSPLPQFELMATNNLQAYILDYDGTRYRVIDYVQLRGPLDNTNVNQVLADPDYSGRRIAFSMEHQSLSITRPLTYGVYNQLDVSQNPNDAPTSGGVWRRPPDHAGFPGINTSTQSRHFLTAFFITNIYFILLIAVTYTNSIGWVQAPYTPSRTVYNYILWQANDPLVHCLASDLNYVNPGKIGWKQTDNTAFLLPAATQNTPGDRFQPWGQNQQMVALDSVDQNACNRTYKDPLIWCPDNWDFPTNKFPTVGWLGRVHRGTPWQTVYLKASGVDTNTWVQLDGRHEFVRRQQHGTGE